MLNNELPTFFHPEKFPFFLANFDEMNYPGFYLVQQKESLLFFELSNGFVFSANKKSQCQMISRKSFQSESYVNQSYKFADNFFFVLQNIAQTFMNKFQDIDNHTCLINSTPLEINNHCMTFCLFLTNKLYATKTKILEKKKEFSFY